jgi:Fic family protein
MCKKIYCFNLCASSGFPYRRAGQALQFLCVTLIAWACVRILLDGAANASKTTLQSVLAKARIWEAHSGESFNDRQRTILGLLIDGFDGKLTSSKWAKLGKCSQDTALRDIGDLLARRVLLKNKAGGRSTSYTLRV